MPDVVGPLERWNGGPREVLELRLIRVLKRNDSPKETNVLGLFGYEEDLSGNTSHGNRDLPMRRFAEW